MIEDYSAAAVGRRIGERLAAIAAGVDGTRGLEERRLNDRSPLRRFLTVSRNFGFVIAMRVAYSKVRGRLCPALALPCAPAYDARHRDVSVLLSTAEQGAATLDAVVEVLAGRAGLEWEVYVCERSPGEPQIARDCALARNTAVDSYRDGG